MFSSGLDATDDVEFSCRQTGFKEVHGQTIVTCDVPVSDTETFEIRYRWKVGNKWSGPQRHYLRGSSTWRLALRNAAPDSGSFQFAWKRFKTGAGSLSDWVDVKITERPTPTVTPTPTATQQVPWVPTNLQASCTNGVLEARWDQVEDAGEYWLQFQRLDGDGLWGRKTDLDYKGTVNQYRVSPASGSYKVRVQAINSFGSSEFTDYNEVACAVELNPTCNAAFGLEVNKVRCFWGQMAGATQYKLQIRAKGANLVSDYQSSGSNTIELSRYDEELIPTQVYADFSANKELPFQSGAYEVRVQISQPSISKWSDWNEFKFELPSPYCVQISFTAGGNTVGNEKSFPIECWFPYYRSDNSLELEISFGEERVKPVIVESSGSDDTAIGDGVRTDDGTRASGDIMLAPKDGTYAVRWRPSGQTSWSPSAPLQVQSSNTANGCVADIGQIMSPVARTTYTAGNSGPRDENPGSNGWGDRPHPLGFHPALDIGRDQTGASDVDSWAVYAVHDGTVKVNRGPRAGIYVTLEHTANNSANCWVTQYMHLKDPSDPGTPANCGLPTTIGGVSVPVAQGTRIGCIGNTGRSFGSHLHFVIKFQDTPLDPYPFIRVSQPFRCPANIPFEVRGFCYKDQSSGTLQQSLCPGEQHRHGSQGCHHKLLDHATGCLVGWHKHDDLGCHKVETIHTPVPPPTPEPCPQAQDHRHDSYGCHHALLDHATGCLAGWHKHDGLACHKTSTSHDPPPCPGGQHRHDSHSCHHALLDHATGCLAGWHKHGNLACHRSSTRHDPPPCPGGQHRHGSEDCHHALLDHATGCLSGWHKHGSYSCHKSSTSHSSK